MGGVASANSLKILEDKFKRVTNIRDNWHSISNQLYSYRMQIADYTKEIEERNAKKSSLGIFAIKEKKELSREIAVLENTITDNKIKINKLLAQQSEFKSKSYEDICATFESIKKQLEALKEQKSSAELREILNKTEFGKKVLKDYDAFKNISVGSCINFGNYYFTPTIKSPITWVVLEKRGSQALLLAKDGIDCKPYHDSNAVITWQQSSIRKWLNSEFISQAFDSDALSRIFSANVLADKNPSYSTNVGEATVDKVFLLSTQEARKYFSSNNARVCNATPYATANGAMSGPAFWYLRTAGNYGANVSYVDRDGAISDAGYYVNANNRVVRPAIWIDIGLLK